MSNGSLGNWSINPWTGSYLTDSLQDSKDLEVSAIWVVVQGM